MSSIPPTAAAIASSVAGLNRADKAAEQVRSQQTSQTRAIEQGEKNTHALSDGNDVENSSDRDADGHYLGGGGRRGKEEEQPSEFDTEINDRGEAGPLHQIDLSA
ncbi:hypothetical protein [Calycomorphotria hydatis]|uniref:Uncharacterized protein n=1 Tax=Calycomorphotria hydatis TaxID=2528027 RepID=A0A517T7W8_9PLAN|nr:hypothetical protein [Calycomorphotria hydatis]QDT64469.1 hypothetical protein V22_17030 [Calycomorphotria hydatis]